MCYLLLWGSLFLLFLPPLSSLHASLSWALHLSFFFFPGILHFHLTLQILLSVHQFSFFTVATLRIHKQISFWYVYKGNPPKVSAYPRTPHTSYKPFGDSYHCSVLPPVPIPLSPLRKQRHSPAGRWAKGSRAVMAWPHTFRPMPCRLKQHI